MAYIQCCLIPYSNKGYLDIWIGYCLGEKSFVFLKTLPGSICWYKDCKYEEYHLYKCKVNLCNSQFYEKMSLVLIQNQKG